MDKYETNIVILKSGDRSMLEHIENEKFDSDDAVINSICSDENDHVAVEDVSIYPLTNFMDSCNNTDDDMPMEERINIAECWLGYVQIKVK